MVHSNFLDPEEGTATLGKSWQDNTDISACLVECAQRLHDRGLIAATDGNVSLRISDDEIWITPSHCMQAFTQPDDMAVINTLNEIEKGIASSERAIHLTVYRNNPTARAVILAHPPSALALSISYPSWTKIPDDILSSMILFTGGVPIVPYSVNSSSSFLTNIIPYVMNFKVMVLSRYAVLSWGDSLDEAYIGIERLEHACSVIIKAIAISGTAEKIPRLNAAEVDELRIMRDASGARTL